jgi:hypothetical protein
VASTLSQQQPALAALLAHAPGTAAKIAQQQRVRTTFYIARHSNSWLRIAELCAPSPRIAVSGNIKLRLGKGMQDAINSM